MTKKRSEGPEPKAPTPHSKITSLQIWSEKSRAEDVQIQCTVGDDVQIQTGELPEPLPATRFYPFFFKVNVCLLS